MMKFYSLLIAILAFHALAAQQSREPQYSDSNNKGTAILLHFNLGSHIPLADMAKRYGADQSVGGGLERISDGNFILGLEGHYMFSQKVKDDPLKNMRTAKGDIIGIDQGLARLSLRERGFYVGALVGKLLVFNEKSRTGLRLTASAGWMQHWIRLQDDNQSVPLVTGEYSKGYDRLTGGIALNQYVGWQKLSKSRRANWYIGIECNQGFTNTLRDFDYAEKRKLDDRRLDIRLGLRAGWILPFYQKKAEEIYY
jgi:hypothetical protein